MAKARVANQTLADVMDRHTVTGAPELCREEEGRIRCLACGHRCLIGEGLRGICKVRFNEGGQLKVPYGYVAGLQCDPVEKKPFFHVYPGSDALTFGMLGCDLHCSYCQNWLTSQALRDADAVAPVRPVTPGQLVQTALRERARLVVSSYNEPLITAEWAVGVFREANAAGLACAFVSNGNATPEVLDFLRPWIVSYKVDLKSYSDRNYRSLGGALDNITRTIRLIHERGIWLEVVTLVIRGFNDGEDELRRAAGFLASVSPDIPWHVTAFHKDYRMTEPDATPPETLIRAAEMGTAEGLRFVYAGNLPGQVGLWEDTRCPSCRTPLIERYGFLVRSYRVTPDGRCPECQARVPGVWPGAAGHVRTGNDLEAYRGRLPRRVAMEHKQPAGDSPLRGDRQTGAARIPLASVPPDVAGSLPAEGGNVVLPTLEKAAAPVTPARAGLTEEKKQRVVTAAAAMLRALITGQPAAFPDDLADVRDHPVAGAFVSLKRGRHLRSCCGLLGRQVGLAQALEHAAARTAWEDVRFPPVSPSELDYLDMEVWLLANPEPVAARGEDRVGAITIGRHGVQVVQGPAHGLFLPSVAVDSNWDARRLLDQVCVKAGLPPTAWKDDATVLYKFEGEALRCRLAVGAPQNAGRRPGVCRPEDVPAFADFCRRNLASLLAGATPDYYLWGAPDGMVSGVVLLLHRPGARDTLHFSQFSLRPGLPLQATLTSLVETAAQQLASQNVTPEALGQIQVGLALLHDPVLHGTVAVPHLEGLEPHHRAVLVLERNKAGLFYDPERTAEDLLAEAAGLARVAQPEKAALYSLDVLTNAVPVRVSTAPRPVRGPAVRPAAVAGKFYEADPLELARTVDRLLAGEARTKAWSAALVPHAGLRFSGRIAADVLKRIKIPSTVIVIGPKHTPLGVEWAVASHETWALPGGAVASDVALARELCQAVPGLELDAAAHRQEHGTEVELPLLARLAPDVRVVGVAVGHADLDGCRRFAESLARLLECRANRPLLLISSDMNHFATDAENRRLDGLALAALDRCDPEELYETVTSHNISMCGVLPAVIVLETLRLLGRLHKAERVGYATSADVTGDTSRVVGYAGMLFGG
jgi:AmmeMemoRadiSam system radical SAM enzyme/AmmeMemoRadiSam system protein B/AmmeMemoRadiSam system protein A